MEIRPVSRLLPSPTRAAGAPLAAPALALDQVTLSGAPPPPPEQTGFLAALKGLFGPPSAALLALETRTSALSANGVQFRRHKTFLGFERSGWTEATPQQAAKLALRGRPLQAARQSDFHDVRGADDLAVLDAFYGAQTPQSLPHAVLAKTLLDLEKSGARLAARDARLNAFSAYQALPSTPITVKTPTHRLTARTEDDVLFAGWLTNPSTPVAAPELAASARALEQRGLSLDGSDDDVLQTYGLLKSGNGFHVHEHGFVLGAADLALFSDPARLDGWAGDRQAELDAVQAAFPERADSAWQLLREDGDKRPFADRLGALKAIDAAREPGPLYRLLLDAPEPLADRAAEAAALLVALGPRNETHVVTCFEKLQALPAEARAPFLERVRQATPTFDAISPLLPEARRAPALDTLLRADAQALPVLARIAAHVTPWSAEGAWTVDETLIRDNPNGRYANNVDAALTTPPFSVPAGARLEYDVTHGLEQTHDWVEVEVKRDGGWQSLARYTGQGQKHEAHDLPAGASVQLRLRFHSDGSNVDTGIRIENPTVHGAPLREHVDGALDRLFLAPRPQADLEALATFTERLGDARAALLAWPALAPDLGAPDFADRLESLATLTARLGADDAQRLWSEVTASSNGTVPERAQRAAAAHDMLRVTHESPTPQQVGELFRRLDSVKASPAVTADLIATARRAVPFHPTGEWAEVPFHGGKAWTDSPNGDYGPGVDSSVTTETVTLRGMKGAGLAFDLQHALEQGYDHAYVEVHDGRAWKPVAHYTGNRALGPERVDLSAFDGGDVKIRLRITTDKSNHFDGIWFGNPRVQDASGLDVPLRDHINAPLTASLIRAATDPGTEAERAARVAALAQLGERTGSVHDAALMWPLLVPHVGQPGFDEKLEAMIALHRAGGTQGARDAWPRLEAAGPPSFTDRLALYEAARTLADTLYSTTRSQRAADIYTALTRVGSDRALGDSLTTLATRGKPWTAEGTWARVQTADGATEWQDSPGGPYEANADMALTSQPFSLVGLKNARLRFDGRYAFEQGYDRCAVEVSDNGRSWKEVARFTGKGAADTIDLSKWDDRRIQVRFRVHSDGSNQDDGISLRDMRIEADNASPCDLDDRINGPLATELLDAATSPSVPLPWRSRNIATVAKMSEALKSTQEAALLWPLLSPFQTSADFEDRAEALTALTLDYGVDAAFKMWPELNAAGGPTSLADRVALLRASVDLSAVLYRDTALPRALGIYQRLAQSGADRGVFDALGTLVRAAQPWVSSGCWTDVVDDRGVHTWDDSPGKPYGNSLDTTLTSAPFSLHGLKSCRLRFDASFDLEQGYDWVQLQASEDGEHWTDLQKWTGKGEGAQEIDLSSWCDRSVQVRYTLHSDASNAGEGMRMSNLRLAVEDAGGQAAEAAIEDAINAPISIELLDAATDPALSNAERVHALHAVEQVSKKVGGVQAAALLWPVLGPHLRTPSFDGLVDVVGTLATKFGVGPTAHVLPILQAEGHGDLPDRVKLFEGAHHIASSALSLGQVEAASVDLYRKLSQGGSDARVGQVLSSFTGDLQAWHAEGAWGREVMADGTRAWSDSPGRKYDNNLEASLMSAPFTVTDGMQLTFRERHDTEEKHDFCAVEVSADGRTWTELARLTGQGQGTQTLDLADFRGKMVQVRFRMHADGSNNAEGVSLWDVNVTSPAGSVPVEDAANAPFLRSVVNAATDGQVSIDERIANLDLLRGLPQGYARRILTFHDAHRDVPLSDLLAHVIQGIPMNSDLDESLRRATLPSKKEGRVEVGDEEVVVGGIKVRKRRDPQA